MTLDQLLQQYEQGPDLLRAALRQVKPEQYGLHPIPGKWSIQQVICHLADFEPIYADRMKRVLVEDNPTLFGGDPDVFRRWPAVRTSQRIRRAGTDLLRPQADGSDPAPVRRRGFSANRCAF